MQATHHGPVIARSGADTLSTTTSQLVRGAFGGLAGGVVFGMLMQMMGMITMVAMLVGSQSAAVGWLVHLAISALLGAIFGVVLGGRARTYPAALGYGLAYGVLWWVLGALIAMPAKLGMPVFAINTAAFQSLMGHLVFGAVLGAVFVWTTRRAS